MKKKIKVLLEMKKYFEEMRDTCDKMLEYTNKELKRIRKKNETRNYN